MNRTLHLAMAVLVSCYGVVSFAQTTTSPTEQKPAPPAASPDKKQEPPASNSNTQGPTQPDTAKMGADYGLGTATAKMGPMEVFTDTMGVDFKPYLQQVVLPTVRKKLVQPDSRICEIPGDEERKGHHRICHSQRWHGQWNEVALDLRRCGPRPRRMEWHPSLQSVPTVAQRILWRVYQVALLLLLQPPKGRP
jgi:hypothetical protein